MNLLELDSTMIPWIGKTGKMIGAFIAENFKKHQLDLTVEQWVLLKRLHDEDGQKQNDLALITQRNKASLTRLINTMEKRNLVARIPDSEDKRVNRIYLIKNGKSVFESTLPIMKDAFDQLQRDISVQEIQSVIHTLKKVQKNIKNLQE